MCLSFTSLGGVLALDMHSVISWCGQTSQTLGTSDEGTRSPMGLSCIIITTFCLGISPHHEHFLSLSQHSVKHRQVSVIQSILDKPSQLILGFTHFCYFSFSPSIYFVPHTVMKIHFDKRFTMLTIAGVARCILLIVVGVRSR